MISSHSPNPSQNNMEKRTSNIKMLRMQALSILPMPHPFLDSDDFAPVPEKLESNSCAKHQFHFDNKEDFEEQEFSFVCTDQQGALIFADEIFDNGQIKPIFPAFDQSLLLNSANSNAASPLRPALKKLFVKHSNNFCSESSVISEEPNSFRNMTMVEMKASDKRCTKSNSTGFSKLWRFRRDLKLRTNSDSKDAFVFLNPSVSNEKMVQNVVLKKEKGKKHKMTLSAHEKLYVMNRKRKESKKRSSFLPYKQQLIGIFTNVNGFSRNLHPF